MINRHTKIVTKRGRIYKYFIDEQVFYNELRKTEQALRIFEKTTLAKIPRILDIDIKNLIICFENIRDAVPVTYYLKHDISRLDINFKNIGEALAYIHNKFVFSRTNFSQIAEMLSPSLNDHPKVSLHGDFTVENILIDKDNKIVIIDWTSSGYLGGIFNYGYFFWDVVWFIESLFIAYPQLIKYSKKREALADIFLESYFRKTSFTFNKEIIVDFAINLNKYFLLNKIKKELKWYQYLHKFNNWKNCQKYWLNKISFPSN